MFHPYALHLKTDQLPSVLCSHCICKTIRPQFAAGEFTVCYASVELQKSLVLTRDYCSYISINTRNRSLQKLLN